MHIHALLQERAKKPEAAGAGTFVLQIGAMDGKTLDPVHQALMENDWQALVVEPVPHHFKALQKTYRDKPHIRTECCAIGNHNGVADFYVIAPEAINSGTVPKWGHGASSLYPDRTALGWPKIAPFVQVVEMPCKTLPRLLEEHDIKRVDILQIDAEGHDYQILKQLDWTQYRPALINLEIVNLPPDEQEATKALLTAQNYDFQKTGYDLVAVARQGG